MTKKDAYKKKQAAERRQQEMARKTTPAVAHLNGKCPVDGCGRPFVYVEKGPPLCDDCMRLLRRITWISAHLIPANAAPGGLVLPGSPAFAQAAKQINEPAKQP